MSTCHIFKGSFFFIILVIVSLLALSPPQMLRVYRKRFKCLHKIWSIFCNGSGDFPQSWNWRWIDSILPVRTSYVLRPVSLVQEMAALQRSRVVGLIQCTIMPKNLCCRLSTHLLLYKQNQLSLKFLSVLSLILPRPFTFILTLTSLPGGKQI